MYINFANTGFKVLIVDVNGNPLDLSGLGAASATAAPAVSTQSNDGNVPVGPVAGQVLPANAGRLNAVLVNTGPNGLFLALGYTAVVNQGIYLAPGASYNVNSSNLFRGAISAISAAAGENTSIVYHEGF